ALRIDTVEFDLAGFDFLQGVVLLLGGELIEGLAAAIRLAILVERGEALAIMIGRRERRLRPLLFGALGERPELVEACGLAVGALELAVDEDGAAGILAAWRFRIRRDDAIDDRLHDAGFVCCEELPGAGPNDFGRR